MGVRLAPRFAIRLVVRDASNVAGQRAAALWDALNRIDSHPPADADLQGWHQKVRQAVGDRGVAEALGEQAPECASCSPKRRRGGKVVDEVGICALISGAICRANERYRKLLKRATGVWPPIRVGVVEGEGPTEPQFGLPFAAWTTCDPSRSRIHLQFSEDWLDAREGNRLLPPDEKTQTGLAYAVFHEMQHALDHALKRPSSFAGSIDHVFADGWMDFAASVLCLDDSPATDSKARRDAVAAIRKERNSASDVQRSERARVAERRQLGTLAASTFLDLVDAGYIEGGGRVFWNFTMLLHAAPRTIDNPLVRDQEQHWRARVVQAIAPVLAGMHSDDERPPSPAERALRNVLSRLSKSPMELEDVLAELMRLLPPERPERRRLPAVILGKRGAFSGT